MIIVGGVLERKHQKMGINFSSYTHPFSLASIVDVDRSPSHTSSILFCLACFFSDSLTKQSIHFHLSLCSHYSAGDSKNQVTIDFEINLRY